MNWYKISKVNDWGWARKKLIEELGKKPSNREVQNKMLEEDFDDKNKDYHAGKINENS